MLKNLVFTDAQKELSVRDIKFSVRLSNCLFNEGIKTIGEILDYTEDRMLEVPSLGDGSLQELKDYLTCLAGENSQPNSSVAPGSHLNQAFQFEQAVSKLIKKAGAEMTDEVKSALHKLSIAVSATIKPPQP